MATPTYEIIASQVLGSSAASITFSSIPQTYRDLIIVSRAFSVGGDKDWIARINGDTSNNYNYVSIRLENSLGSISQDSQTSAVLNYVRSSTTVPTFSIAHFIDYSATNKQKTIISRGVASPQVSGSFTLDANCLRWANNSAITSIEIGVSSNSWAAGSSFYLYGIAA